MNRINLKLSIQDQNAISGGYIIYVGIDMAKKKFDYCIIDSELSVKKRGMLINNNYGFSEFLVVYVILCKYKPPVINEFNH